MGLPGVPEEGAGESPCWPQGTPLPPPTGMEAGAGWGVQRRLPAAQPASSLSALASCCNQPIAGSSVQEFCLWENTCMCSSESCFRLVFCVCSLLLPPLSLFFLLWCPGLPVVSFKTLTKWCKFSESFWHLRRPFRIVPNLQVLPPSEECSQTPTFRM